MVEVETKFFEFDQNNSGGHWDIDDEKGIGPRVWIEAIDIDHARSVAERIGIYFNGVVSGQDCPCCGDRWSDFLLEGADAPELKPDYDWYWHPTVYIHRIDGTIERVAKPAEEPQP